MKKILAFCLLISLLIGLVGCGKKAHIVFPFAASDVTKIEVIYKDGESDAQKKTVNKETEIDSLYKSFSELSVQEKDCASADTLGSVVFTCSLKTLGLIISHQVILSGYGKIYLEKVK